MKSNNLLEAALGYLKRGWSAIPLCPHDHKGVSEAHQQTCKSPGKCPLSSWKDYQERLPKESELRLYWNRCQTSNVGVCLGPVSGVIGVDVDNGDEGSAYLTQLSKNDLPDTLAFFTPNGGHRLLYRLPNGKCPGNRSFRAPDGRELVRILSKGTQTVMPPSIHKNGPYVWIPDCDPDSQAIADAPQWLLDLPPSVDDQDAVVHHFPSGANGSSTAPATKPRTPSYEHGLSQEEKIHRARLYLEACDPAISGQGGHDHTFKIAHKLIWHFDLSSDDALQLLKDDFNPRCQPPWSDKELRHKIEDAMKHPATPGTAYQQRPQPTPIKVEWEQPVPLSETPEVLPFPLDALPNQMRAFLADASAALACPSDYLAVPALVIAGAAIGSSMELRIKEGHWERPCLFATIVGAPGTKKTPAIKTVGRPVFEEEDRRFKEWKSQKAAYDGAEDKESLPVPVLRSVWVADVTREALVGKIAASPRGLLLLVDELTGLMAGMNQYKPGGRGADMQMYLSLWSGAAISVDRKGSPEPLRILHPYLGIVGGIQPDLLESLKVTTARSDGFIDRFLFAYPAMPPATGENWMQLNPELRQAWTDALATLWALPMQDDAPVQVNMTQDARQAWQAFTEKLAAERNDPGFPEVLQGPWSKLEAYGARLALVIHCLRRAYGETAEADVELTDMERSSQIIEYLKTHAKKVYAVIGADPTTTRAKKVLRWIKDKQKTSFTRRDVYRAMHNEYRKVKEVDPPLDLLAAHGFIRPTQTEPRMPAGGRPTSQAYEVNPNPW